MQESVNGCQPLQALFVSEKRFLARPASGFGRSLDEWVGEEENQGNHQAINRQGLHECQGQQQHTSQVICHLRLARDAINASAGSNALANTRTNCSQANGEASANGGQSRDPHGALISKCCCGVTKVAAVKAAAVPVLAVGADTWELLGAGTKAVRNAPQLSSTAPVRTKERAISAN